jgi:predicted kinase
MEDVKKDKKSTKKDEVLNKNVIEINPVLKEEEIDEAVLTFAQRRQRALAMRRNERKIEVARERLKNRVANSQHLVTRSRKAAIKILRKKLAGDRGVNYDTLPVADKIMVDKLVDKRKSAIGRIAARLLPKIRQAEFQRVAAISKNREMKEGLDSAFEGFLDESKRYHMAFHKDGRPRFDKRFKVFRNMVAKESVDLAVFDEAWNTIAEEQKIEHALMVKAERANIDFDLVRSAFDEGYHAWEETSSMTPTQSGFANVNAFVAEGKLPGLWANIHARRKKGLRPKRPGEEGYPKTLNIDEAFEQHLSEGIHDPSIFKAVFLAGGPGSGKSFIVGKTALTSLGMKVINSDQFFERALAKAGMKPTPEDIYSDKGQELRNQAKVVTGKYLDNAMNGRLGLVIDGTGKDYEKIEKQAEKLKKIGYEVAMIFVNTNLDTAQARNQKRSRTIDPKEVDRMWHGVQDNMGKFQNYFGTKMFIIDNSDGSNYEGAILSTYRKISAWSKTAPASPAAKAWIQAGGKLQEAHLFGKEPVGPKLVKGMKHHLGIGVPFKHQAKDAIANFDRDVDSDVDAADKNKNIPDEAIGTNTKTTKLLLKKYDYEKKHSKVGDAFEAYTPAGATITPTLSKTATEKEILDNLIKHLGAALQRADKAQRLRTYHEEAGAGFEGTDKLVKKYKKDTPGQSVNEAFESLFEAEDVEITMAQMKDFEKFVDRMFEKYKIDFNFTKHFGDRMNDTRNAPKIKLKELADLIKKIYAKHGNPLKGKAGVEVVIKDIQSDLNMPIAIEYDSKNDEIDVVAKTIMRKKNFTTPNQVIKY